MTIDDLLQDFSEALPREQLRAEAQAGWRDDGPGVYLQWGRGDAMPAQWGQHPGVVLANLPSEGDHFAYRLVADPAERQSLVQRLYQSIEYGTADRP